MEKEINKFTQKVEGVIGDQIPDWDFPGGSAIAFFDEVDKNNREKEEKQDINKSNTYEKWL